jgi:hypothetical protein
MLGIGKQELVLANMVYVKAVSCDCIIPGINAMEVAKS